MIIGDFPYITLLNLVPMLNSLIFPALKYFLICSILLIAYMSVPKITLHHQLFAYIIEMVLNHRLDSWPQIVGLHLDYIALQSYNEIDGNVA